jgi:hypothetical protein
MELLDLFGREVSPGCVVEQVEEVDEAPSVLQTLYWLSHHAAHTTFMKQLLYMDNNG